jgi:hypothetical protein
MPLTRVSRNVQAKQLAFKMAVLGGITLAAIVGIAVFLVIHMTQQTAIGKRLIVLARLNTLSHG